MAINVDANVSSRQTFILFFFRIWSRSPVWSYVIKENLTTKYYISLFLIFIFYFFLQATFQNSFTNLSFVISWIKGNKINWKNKKFELKKIFYPFSKSSSTFTSRIFYILPWIFKEKKYVRSIFNSSSTRKLYDKGKESTAQLLQKKGEKNEMVY